MLIYRGFNIQGTKLKANFVMKPESNISSKARGNARSPSKRLCSDDKAYGNSETQNNSVQQKSQNPKSLDLANRKPWSKRKRISEFWPNSHKEHAVSENIGKTEEAYEVKRTKSTSFGRQGLEDGMGKQSLANQLADLEEAEISPSPNHATYFNSAILDKNDLRKTYGETGGETGLDKLKNLEGEKPTHSHYPKNSCLRDSKKGKTLMLTQSSGALDNLAEKEKQMLAEKLKEGWDDFNCLTVLRLNSLGTSQITSGDKKEQLRTSNEMVQSGKQSETIPGKSLETSQLTSRDSEEEQLKAHNKIFLLGKEIKRETTTSMGVCFSDSDFKVHHIKPSGCPKVPFHAGIAVCNMQKTEVQASKQQPISEETSKISDPSSIDLQMPLLSNVQMRGNAFNFFRWPVSRINVQGSRSMSIGSSSTTKLPFHANLKMPRREQLPSNDPFQIELETLRKNYAQDLMIHYAKVWHMKWNRYKEVGEILRKYDISFHEAQAAFQNKIKDIRSKVQKVCQSKLLANAVMLKHNDQEEAVAPETSRAASDNPNQLVQNSTQMSAERLDQHPPVTAPSEPVVNQPLQVPATPYSSGTMLSFTSGSYIDGLISRAADSYIRNIVSRSSKPSSKGE